MTDHGKPVSARNERVRRIASVLWITLILNWTVAVLKIVFGLVTRCMAITADGVHSLSDGATNVIGLIAIRVAGHPPDRDHPYGHQKFETLASLIIAFMLFVVSFGIFRESIEGFLQKRVPDVSLASYLVMGFTLFVNLGVVYYERRQGRRLKSDLLVSDSWHTLSDVFVTLSVFVALIGIQLGIPRADAVFSFIIAVVIFATAIGILRKSSDILVDRAVMDADEIKRIALAVEGVRDCHEIRTRGMMDNVYVDMHVLVDSEMSVRDSHRLANIIEHNISRDIPGIADVVVHIEPLSHDHREV